jgi:hypothetical protein
MKKWDFKDNALVFQNDKGIIRKSPLELVKVNKKL